MSDLTDCPVPHSKYDRCHNCVPVVHVGTIGHVDHGKTTLTAALTKVAQIQQKAHCNGHTQFEYDCIDCSDALERVRISQQVE